MELQPGLQSPSNGEAENPRDQSPQEISSSCSTPFVSAPSSPGGISVPAAFFHSALEPPSPSPSPTTISVSGDSFEFEFSARLPAIPPGGVGSMSSADELFLNGQIRPMKVGIETRLQMPEAPLTNEEDGIDTSDEVARGREQRVRPCRSPQRRTRSMSTTRVPVVDEEEEEEEEEEEATAPTLSSSSLSMDTSTDPPMPTSSSRSSSAGRSSNRWVFLKDFLYRSKSEGRRSISGGGAGKYLWPSMTASPAKGSKKEASGNGKRNAKKAASVKMGPAGGGGGGGGKQRRVPAPSAHEMLYTANRAQAEELRKKTFLPYRQGLLGCLGFSSRSYGAINGFARALNPVSSR